MTLNVITGATDKPAASGLLASVLTTQTDVSGDLFIGYPVVRTAHGPYVIDALLFSPTLGIVIFDLVEGDDPTDYRERQDDIANKLEAKLRSYKELMLRRDLQIKVHAITFGPAVPAHKVADGYPIANRETLATAVKKFIWPTHSEHVYRAALAAIENISTIREPQQRRVVQVPTSRGTKLDRLEKSIATLDSDQSRAVIETVDGIQRIRGLAGSGKTIVLALKAAYLHTRYPDWRIAVTFNTRSLKPQFRRLIRNFVLLEANQEPNWENLRIVNAWGAKGDPDRDGIYHEFSRTHEIDYFTFGEARHRFGTEGPLQAISTHALDQVANPQAAYDAILIDEAQDFPPEFLRLCHAFLRQPKRLIYAYDELQSLSGLSLPPPDEIFDSGDDGSNERFTDHTTASSSRDIILPMCYRNSRPILTTAHAIGFGIYRKPPAPGRTGLVQMFDRPELWLNTGYHADDGVPKEGKHTTLSRTPDTSPAFLEEHSDINDLVQFVVFEDANAQDEWLAAEIERNLRKEELRPDDIMVINPNPRTTRERVGPVRRRLFEKGINSHIAGVNTDPDVFFAVGEESITFTGIHRAKGNEAGMVYIMNADDCHAATFNLANLRNRLFTAITRSKAWIRVLGVGLAMEELATEYKRLKENHFHLTFKYPTAEEREHLRIVHRDMTEFERRQLEVGQQHLHEAIAHMDSGSLRVEDIDPEDISRLKKILQERSDAN